MTIKQIRTPNDLLEHLIDIGGYMLTNGIGEMETTCGKLKIKVEVDLIVEEGDAE